MVDTASQESSDVVSVIPFLRHVLPTTFWGGVRAGGWALGGAYVRYIWSQFKDGASQQLKATILAVEKKGAPLDAEENRAIVEQVRLRMATEREENQRLFRVWMKMWGG